MTYHESVRVETKEVHRTVVHAVNVDTRFNPAPSLWITRYVETPSPAGTRVRRLPIIPVTRYTNIAALALPLDIAARLYEYRLHGMNLTTGEPDYPKEGA